MSPPARGRGLKLVFGPPGNGKSHVAPRTGAWIETRLAVSQAYDGRPARGWIETTVCTPNEIRSPARGVD